jgi:transcription elongation factor Elf1
MNLVNCEANRHKQCKCGRCGTRYEFEPNDIMYEIKNFESGNSKKENYEFYLKCGNCGYKIIIHEEYRYSKIEEVE